MPELPHRGGPSTVLVGPAPERVVPFGVVDASTGC